MSKDRKRGKPDLCFEHGLRFHLAPPKHGMPPRHVMLLFSKKTKDGAVAYQANLDQPWPDSLENVSAVVIGEMGDLDEAIAFAASREKSGKH